MPYCPTCKKEFDDSFKDCPTDRVPLVDDLGFQTIEGPTTTWVEITSVGTEDEARLLQGFLEAEGIPCQFESLKFNMEPINFGTMGEIRIYVAAENEQAAHDLLREREDKYQALAKEDSVITDEGPAEIADDAQTVAEAEES